MKTIVVYFSNSGNTRTVAQALAVYLDADIEEIRERKERALLQMPKEGDKPEGFAVMKAAMGGFLRLSSQIEGPRHDPSAYDLVIVGSPVWAGGLTPAVRSYMKKHRGKLRNIAFFCTGESPEEGHAFDQMKHLARKEPVAVMPVPADEIRANNVDMRVSEFASRVSAALA
ncbi:MAG: flavodoxin family protein [Chloroflexota bacterium]